MRRKTTFLALAGSALGTLATASLQAQSGKMEMPGAGTVTRAVAVLHPTKSGGDASGVVTFTKVEGGVKVEAEVKGLTPGEHGFHIHEWGDTSTPEAKSAGGHFNPAKAEHAGPATPKRHTGDLGNITANERGVAKLELVDPHLSFTGPTSIIGRGLIVHEKADDYKTQPTGNAGGRVAAAVIGIGDPKGTAK